MRAACTSAQASPTVAAWRWRTFRMTAALISPYSDLLMTERNSPDKTSIPVLCVSSQSPFPNRTGAAAVAVSVLWRSSTGTTSLVGLREVATPDLRTGWMFLCAVGEAWFC